MGSEVLQVVTPGWLEIEVNVLEHRLALRISDFLSGKGLGTPKPLSGRGLECVSSCVLEGRGFLRGQGRKLKIMAHRAGTVDTWNTDESHTED